MSLTHEYNLKETDIVNRLGESASFDSKQIFEIKAVYRYKNGKDWKLCSALIHRVDADKEEFIQEYNEDAFFTVYKKYSSVSEILFNLFEIGLPVAEKYPPIIIDEISHWEEILIPSTSSLNKVPIRHYLYSLDSCNYSDEQLIGYKLPHYSSFNEKLKEFITYENYDANKIHFLIEDKRALLDVKDEKVTLISECDVHMSGTLEGVDGMQHVNSENQEKSSIDLLGVTSVELWVVDKNNLILDYISSSEYKYRYQLERAEIPLEDLIKKKIENGETIDCEFKKFIDFGKGDSKADEIDRTVCAFSNTNGGDLIIGVSDNGEVLGIGEGIRSKYKTSLDEAINSYSQYISKRLYENLTVNNCFTINTVDLFGKKLIVVNVEKVKSWNFLQATDVPYTRKGSTNYKATHLVALEHDNNSRLMKEVY